MPAPKFNHSRHLKLCLTILGLKHLIPRNRGATRDLTLITQEQLKALVRLFKFSERDLANHVP